MAIYDVNGNVISGGSSGDDFFSRQNVYNPIDFGDIDSLPSGVVNIDNGTITSNSNYKHTDYVAVTGTKLYRLSQHCSYNNYYTACYNSSKTFIAGATLSSYNYDYYDTSGKRFMYCNFTLPENTAYIRTTFYKTVNEAYLLTTPMPNPFNINAYVITTTEEDKLLAALDIPNLDVINRFKGKKLIVAGDSIVEKNTTSSKVWSEWLADWLGVKVYNDGQGGTGFAKDYYQRGSTIYRIENNWASLYPAEPDIILVMGNQNDGTGGGGGYAATYPSASGYSKMPLGTSSDTASTFSEYGAMRRLLEDLTTSYPKAKIGIISSTPRDNNLTSLWPDKPKSYGLGWYDDYVTAQKHVCADFGIPFLDLYHQNPVLRPYINGNVSEYYWDGSSAEVGEPTGAVHPNEKGHLEGIARPVYEWMLGWC